MKTNKGIFTTRKIILLSLTAFLVLALVCQLAVSGANDGYSLKIKNGIDKIVIKNTPGQELILEKNDSSWKVSQLKDGLVLASKEADPDMVSRMETYLSKIEVIGTVSRKGDDQRYGFGEASSIFVSAYKEGKLLRSIEIGKSSVTSEQVYCRMDGKNEVLLSGGNPKSLFANSFDKLALVDGQ
ncbi:MAG: DUF4340 domain-containing protein [Treponemataceae bacterium]|nr:DUF4340 domain-containing protein [Treponemataceae bacterium]